jgi:hypothetical protein
MFKERFMKKYFEDPAFRNALIGGVKGETTPQAFSKLMYRYFAPDVAQRVTPDIPPGPYTEAIDRALSPYGDMITNAVQRRP